MERREDEMGFKTLVDNKQQPILENQMNKRNSSRKHAYIILIP